uniref:NADH-ubiquinone oxidoreductase chain 2 n=1 Tax=Mileewa alara TaxID=2545672 RepID=A0A899IKG4_9HEMI|nr:NADH dehydrogenase subunit 2 [Mileewa alara]
MKLNLTNMLLYYMMLIATLLSVSSNNWMMMWSGLEISLMSFIPLMSGGMLGSESSMKYFIVQSISSSLLVMSIMLMMMTKMHYNFLFLISLVMKMGIAPFHNWVLSIISSLNYQMVFILFTIMKVTPLVMMSYLNEYNDLFIFISLIIGSIFSLNQNNIRKLMAYSSIYNMSYIMSSINMNSIWMTYLMIYSIILMLLLAMFLKLKINYINQLSMNEFSLIIKTNLWISMLSLGGMPPLLGFLPKLIIFQMMILKKMFFLLVIMTLTSLIMMFFYMRMVFFAFMNYSVMLKHNIKYNSKLLLWPTFININMFPIMLSMKYLT